MSLQHTWISKPTQVASMKEELAIVTTKTLHMKNKNQHVGQQLQANKVALEVQLSAFRGNSNSIVL